MRLNYNLQRAEDDIGVLFESAPVANSKPTASMFLQGIAKYKGVPATDIHLIVTLV
jgi:hypothetical protein